MMRTVLSRITTSRGDDGQTQMNLRNHNFLTSDRAIWFTIEIHDALSILDFSAEVLETRLLSADANRFRVYFSYFDGCGCLAFMLQRLWIAVRLYGSVSIEGTDVDRMRDFGVRFVAVEMIVTRGASHSIFIRLTVWGWSHFQNSICGREVFRVPRSFIYTRTAR
jgi:hypothetical protein